MNFAKIMLAAAVAVGTVVSLEANDAKKLINQTRLEQEKKDEVTAQTESPQKIRKIWNACQTYAQKNNGVFPENLAQLVKQDLLTPEDLISPLDRKSKPAKKGEIITEENISYIYLGKGLTLKNDKGLPFLFEKMKGCRRTKITKRNGHNIRYYNICNLSGNCYQISFDKDLIDYNWRENEVVVNMTYFILKRYRGNDKNGCETIRNNSKTYGQKGSWQ